MISVNDFILLGIGTILGAISGVTFQPWLSRLIKSHTYRKKEKEFLNDIPQILVPEDINSIFDRIPRFYDDNDIELTVITEQQYFGITEELQNKLSEYNFICRTSTTEELKHNLLETVTEIIGNENNAEDLIQNSIIKTCNSLIQNLHDGLQRFNGDMLGIKNIRLNRSHESTAEYNAERPTFRAQFYKTDYFTHLVIGEVFQQIKKKINSHFTIEDINKYIVFCTSFGLNTFIIVKDRGGYKVLVTRRSDSVIVDRGKLHFSVNEAVTTADIDAGTNSISLFRCTKRGIFEELGLSNKSFNMKYHGVYCFGIQPERFESYAMACAEICFTQKSTIEDLLGAYHLARDQKFETKELRFVPLEEIKTFIEANRDELSHTCRIGLNLLYLKYKLKLLFDE